MQLRELVGVEDVEEVRGPLDRSVTGVTCDSRSVRHGDVFFALVGSQVDGHDFIGSAVARGAAAVVVQHEVTVPPYVASVRVRNVRRVMGRWAASFHGHPSRRMTVVGVTGTNGKTTMTYLLESIFSVAGYSPGVVGTVNYRYGGRVVPAPYTTPEATELQGLLAEMAGSGVQSLAMEVSSHSLEMERVRGVDFDGAVFANLSRDHLDFHGDMEHYFSAKASLFTDYLPGSVKERKFAVVHGSGSWGQELLRRLQGRDFQVVTYGEGKSWDIHPLEVEKDLQGLRGKIRMGDKDLSFTSRLIGMINLENIMGAVGVSWALGLAEESIADGIARLDAVPGRLERIGNSRGVTILVDYAHSPDALEKVLCALRPLTPGRLILVFGCGGDRDRGKRPLMGGVAARLGDLVILSSDNPRTEEPMRIIEEIEEGVHQGKMKKLPGPPRLPEPGESGYWLEPDRRSSIRMAFGWACSGDLILIAGKGHEDYQIVRQGRLHFDDREVVREELGFLDS